MFGRKNKERASLIFNASVIATMAQACLAIDYAANLNGAGTRYFGNLLLGTLHTVGIQPSVGKKQGAIWYGTRNTLGDIGDHWEFYAALGPNLDKCEVANLSRVLASLAFTVSRSDMEETFPQSLAPIFGKSNAAELEETERLACLHAGVTLTTVFEDIHGCSKREAEERVLFASYAEAIFLILFSKVEEAQR